VKSSEMQSVTKWAIEWERELVRWMVIVLVQWWVK
jgi:hypothetical protein